MSCNVIVWDIETIPDLKGFAAANGHDGKSDEALMNLYQVQSRFEERESRPAEKSNYRKSGSRHHYSSSYET